MIKEIVVQTIETPFFIIIQRAVDIAVLCRNTRMVFAALRRVFNKEHIVYQTHQAIAYTFIFGSVRHGSEIVNHFALCRHLVPQTIASVAFTDKIVLSYKVSQFSEVVADEPVHDIRTGMQFRINPKIITATQLVRRERESRIEHAEKAMHGIHRNLPYAEEAKNMIYAISVEIFAHLAEAGFPPRISVAGHDVPFVSRKSPILSEYRKIVRRSSGLRIQIEQFRALPCIGTCTGDSDRYIALYSHSMLTCISGNLAHLSVKMILKIADIVYVVGIILHKLFYLCSIIAAMLRPLYEIRSGIAVAQHAEGSIGQ